ncbi:MAG TPA: GAF domain-containing protein [Steroidobacteraceae bacterium]
MSHVGTRYEFKDKPSDYASLARELTSLLAGETDLIANAANMTALIFDAVPRLNWTGIYFLKNADLVVGPFQGRPACVRIALGTGVCGKAARQRITIVVPDVDQFPGHIACDAASRSEIVIPLIVRDALLGVLDIDSPELARFDAADREGLERLASIFVASVTAERLA